MPRAGIFPVMANRIVTVQCDAVHPLSFGFTSVAVISDSQRTSDDLTAFRSSVRFHDDVGTLFLRLPGEWGGGLHRLVTGWLGQPRYLPCVENSWDRRRRYHRLEKYRSMPIFLCIEALCPLGLIYHQVVWIVFSDANRRCPGVPRISMVSPQTRVAVPRLLVITRGRSCRASEWSGERPLPLKPLINFFEPTDSSIVS